jgi:hypothetical protein
VDAGFDYDRGQEKEVKDNLKPRNGEAAAIGLWRYARRFAYPKLKAVDSQVQARIGSRTDPAASFFFSLLAISQVTVLLALGEL